MYRCILVPLDGSPFGEHALPYAASIARRCGAVLHLTHVHLPPIVPSGAETAVLPPAWFEMTRDEKRTYLDALGARVASTYGIRVETRLMEGGVATALERHAMSCAAGLIVMSTHAHVGLSRLWHHGVADQLSRDLPLPLLLVRPDTDVPPGEGEEEPRLTHFLLPLDGSEEAEGMVVHATRLGKAVGARYTLMRVVQAEPALGQSMLGQDATLNQQRIHSDHTAARQYLNAVAERMRSSSLEVETEIVAAPDVAGAVIQRIRKGEGDARGRIDLVAIETHPRNAMSRLLFRGTTDTLVKESPVPVLVFHQSPVPTPQLAGAVGLATRG
ncbi:MAG TPA: universal stress protein [Longimicrobiaceae bacterium]|nr:universal stress protein [Longimicrobium sp.]